MKPVDQTIYQLTSSPNHPQRDDLPTQMVANWPPMKLPLTAQYSA